jgi:hypothetical protein
VIFHKSLFKYSLIDVLIQKTYKPENLRCIIWTGRNTLIKKVDTVMQEPRKIKVAGKQTLAYTRQERKEVGDTEGHILSLIEAEGINISSGDSEFMNGAQIINVVTSDLVNFNGPIHGYSITTKKGDSAVGKFDGKIITTISADGTPVAVIDDVHLTWIKGTGQFLNIKGSATAKGRYISRNIYNVEWEGEYWIEK